MPITGKTILDAADVPQNSVIVPGNPTPVLMRGSTNVSTDNNQNTTTPVSFNLEQIGEVLFTLGQALKAASISVAIASDQIVPIQQADLSTTGNLTAAQPTQGTPVAGGTVQLAVGQGQSTWKALLLAGGGGFTSATTIVADKSLDGGTTWITAGFKVAGSLTNTTVQSAIGPGPIEITGNVSGATHIRIRCSVLNSTEVIAVTLRGAAGIADIGLMSSIPAGTNNIGTLAPFVDGSVIGTVTNDNDTVAIACPGGQATAYVKVTGTFVGTLLFEGTPDGGTNWDALNAVQVGGSSVTNQTTTTGAWRVNVSGLTSFHVKLHPVTSGTANIRINLSQGVHNVAVTNATALGQNVMANSAPVVLPSDQIVPVKGNFTEQASLSAGALNADLVPSTDMSAYKWWSLHLNANAYVGTLTFQCSNDNVTWQSMFVQRPDALTTLTATTTSPSFFVHGPVFFRFLRVRMTAYTSGTAQATAEYYNSAAAPTVIGSAFTTQAGTWTVQPGNTPNTTPWLVTGSNNNAVQAANTAGNVVIKGSAGLLQGAMITATGTVGLTVYDNASTNSGTPVLVIPANPVVGTLYPVNGWCKNGITSAGVANCPGVTFFFA